MLSILIPAYRWSVMTFTGGLYRQARDLGISFEIRIYDDASGFDYEADLGELLDYPEVVLRVMPENLGRSRIRNKLAAEAAYPWLLFADADSGLIDSRYLRRYWEARKEEYILTGGTAYSAEPPADSGKYFRWYYGRHREVRSAAQRTQNPFAGFTTHHFFCHRSVFDRVSFPEMLTTYGHEDTFFGAQLQEAGLGIRHLENPLLHTGLETTDQYLQKTKEALNSLAALRKKHPELQTRLSQWYDTLQRFGLSGLIRWIYRRTEQQLLQNIRGDRPRLWLFDLYRLGYFAQISRIANNSAG